MSSTPSVACDKQACDASLTPPGASIPTAPAKATLLHSWHTYPLFRYLWVATVCTHSGQWLQNIALAWLALSLTNSPAFVGQIGFASGVPVLLFALPAGVLLDRLNRRRVLLACQICIITLALLVGFVIYNGQVQPWYLIVAAIFSGMILAISQPATQTLVPGLVPRHDLPNAVALSGAGISSTRIFGPSLAGVVISIVGLAGCFFTQAGIVLIAFFLTLRIRLTNTVQVGVKTGGGLLEGLRIIRHDRKLLGLLLLGSMPAFFGYPYLQMMPSFVRDILQGDVKMLGMLMAFSGVGAFSGALVMARLYQFPRIGLLTIGNGIAYGLLLITFTFVRIPLVIGPILLASGVVGSAFNSGVNILVQTNTTEEMRGRVLGALALSIGLTPIGALLMGELAQHFRVDRGIEFCALACVVGIVLVTWRFRELTQL